MSCPYPEYRDSGVEWLGDVPEHWWVKRLRYVVSTNDETLSDAEDPLRPIQYVDIGSIDSTDGIVQTDEMVFEDAPSRARRLVQDGDTMVSTVRTYLRAIVPVRSPPSDMVVSTGFAVIRPLNIDPGFSSWALREYGFVEELVACSTGVSYPAINASKIGDLPIPLPTRDEQRAIAAFLDRETERIDALVEKKRRLIERLKEYRIALITRTVTRGLPPEAARAAGLDPLPRLKPSGVEWLGDVPEHWGILPLKRWVSTRITDGPHETPDFLADGISFMSAESMVGGRLDFDRRRGFISHEQHEVYCRKCRPRRNDIFMCKSGATTGKVAIVDTAEEFSVWSPLALIRVDQQKVLAPLMFAALQAHYVQQQVQDTWSYGTQPNLAMEAMEQLVVVLPPIDEQHAVVAFLRRVTERIDALRGMAETAIERLQEHRIALITAAVTGKIDVREAAPEAALRQAQGERRGRS